MHLQKQDRFALPLIQWFYPRSNGLRRFCEVQAHVWNEAQLIIRMSPPCRMLPLKFQSRLLRYFADQSPIFGCGELAPTRRIQWLWTGIQGKL